MSNESSWPAILLTAFVVLFLLSVRKRHLHLSKMRQKYSLPSKQMVAGKTRLEGETPVYRHPSVGPDGQLINTHPTYAHVKTLFDAFQNGLKLNPNGGCLGTRVATTPYVYESYLEVAERVRSFGSGLLELGLEPRREHCVGVMGKNCPEWLITELACAGYSLVVVPLYDTLGPDAIAYIINQTQLSVVVVEADKLSNILAAAPQCPSLKYVIKIGAVTPEDKKQAKDAKVSLLYFKGVEAMGKDAAKEYVPAKPEDLLTICYTSGTTGNPKGVMLTHHNVVSDANGVFLTFPADSQLGTTDVHLSFLPLAHIFEQLIACALICVGARIAFYRGDVLKLLEDVAEAKPTLFPAVPRLLNRIYSKIMLTVNQGSALKRKLFLFALEKKRQLVRQGVVTKDSFWDKLVFKKIQARLGGNVKMIITGAAPISADVLDFFRCAFGCEVLEGYGQTETSAALSCTRFGDYSIDHGGHVGAVLPCCELKLVDIPEMNYRATDENPRGEIWVRGHNVFKGYFKLPDQTRDTLTADGWCKTGDVGMILPGGTLKIIDRKKHIFKLSQGEYIAPEKVENIYVKAPYVAQVFVYGDSLKHCLVGVVVVDIEQLSKYCNDHKITLESSDAWLNSQQEFKKIVLEGLVAQGKSNKLHSFEQVKDIYLSTEQWTPENGLLTPSMKPKRHEIKNKYIPVINKMYSALD